MTQQIHVRFHRQEGLLRDRVQGLSKERLHDALRTQMALEGITYMEGGFRYRGEDVQVDMAWRPASYFPSSVVLGTQPRPIVQADYIINFSRELPQDTLETVALGLSGLEQVTQTALYLDDGKTLTYQMYGQP